MPCKSYDNDIERGDEEQPQGIREGIPVQLVHDEQREYDQRDGIVPELLAQKADDEPQLYNAVCQEIERCERQRAQGKTLDGMEKKISDDVVRVFCELVLCDPLYDAEQKLLRDEIRGNAGDDL